MNIFNVVKFGVSLGTGIGASIIVNCAINAVVPEQIGKIGKILVVAGSMAIGGIVGDAASKYTEDFMDKIGDAVKSVKASVTAKS